MIKDADAAGFQVGVEERARYGQPERGAAMMVGKS
jgi:hypothetical protein